MSFLQKVNKEVTAEIVPALLQKIVDWLESKIKNAKLAGVEFDLITLADWHEIERIFNVKTEVFLSDLSNELISDRPRVKCSDEFIKDLVTAMPKKLGLRFRERFQLI